MTRSRQVAAKRVVLRPASDRHAGWLRAAKAKRRPLTKVVGEAMDFVHGGQGQHLLEVLERYLAGEDVRLAAHGVADQIRRVLR